MTQGWGNHIRRAREAKKLRQEDLAVIVGVRQSVVSGWEREKDFPPLQRLAELCDALDLQVEEIVAYMATDNDTERAIRGDMKLNQEERGALAKIYLRMIEGRHDGQFAVKPKR